MSQTGVLAYEIQKMIKQYVDAAYAQEPWRRYVQNYMDTSARRPYEGNQKQPVKSAVPETTPNRLRRDIPPEMFDADKRTPMRQYRNQNMEQSGYHEVSDYSMPEDVHRSNRNMFNRPLEEKPEEDWVAKIADVMQNQFGLRPRDQTVMYCRPYSD